MSTRVGTKLPAGLWSSTVLADMDFETYSEAGYLWDDALQKWVSAGAKGSPGLAAVGTAAYAEHPSTEVLSLAYDLKDGRGWRMWLPALDPPQDLLDHVSAGGLIEAHNSLFEFFIWNHVFHERMGWPLLPLVQLRCSMSKARAFGMPGRLAVLSKAVGLTLKDTAKGTRVINRYCKPRNPTAKDTRTRIHPWEEAKGVELYEYNIGDIEAEAAVSGYCPDLTPEELDTWLMDQRINVRGVHVDVDAVKAFSAILDDALVDNDRRLRSVTNGELVRTSEVQQMLQWLHDRGVHLDSLDEDAVSSALKDMPAGAERNVLELRRASASAGVKKVYSLLRQTSRDGRLRGLFQYYRAITGRWSSEGFQTQNLVSGGPEMEYCERCGGWFPSKHANFCPNCNDVFIALGDPKEWDYEIADRCIQMLKSGGYPAARAWFGDYLFAAMAGCLRGMLVAGPGCDLLCSDYSAIEGVVLAALAGEEWRLDVFRTHGKIYEKTASDITGVPFEEILACKQQTGSHHKYRKVFGKVGELASGFAGWIGAWKNFGAGDYLEDAEIKDAIIKWREASPAIVEFWGGQYRKTPGKWEFTWDLHGLEGAVVTAILNPGQWQEFRGLYYGVFNDVLYCRLLSGRYLSYHQPRLDPYYDDKRNVTQYRISHMVYNTNPKKGRVGWIRTDTWCGTLTENVVQATARDILVNGMKQVEAAGYKIVLHVHDEIVAEVPAGWGSVEEFERLMTTLPAWCADWPIKAAGGWRGHRYRKD